MAAPGTLSASDNLPAMETFAAAGGIVLGVGREDAWMSAVAEAFVEAFDAWKAARPDLTCVTVQLEVDYEVDGDDVSLENLECSRPGTGLARQCMVALCDMADEHGVCIKGVAWGSQGRGSPQERFDQLKAWYASLGFVIDEDPEVNYIYRVPTAPVPACGPSSR